MTALVCMKYARSSYEFSARFMRTADREQLLKMYTPQPLVITEWEVLYSHSLVNTVLSYHLQLHLYFVLCTFPFSMIGLAELILKMIKMVKMSKGIAVKNGWV